MLSENIKHFAKYLKREGRRQPYCDRPDVTDHIVTELQRTASIFRDLEAADQWREDNAVT